MLTNQTTYEKIKGNYSIPTGNPFAKSSVCMNVVEVLFSKKKPRNFQLPTAAVEDLVSISDAHSVRALHESEFKTVTKSQMLYHNLTIH